MSSRLRGRVVIAVVAALGATNLGCSESLLSPPPPPPPPVPLSVLAVSPREGLVADVLKITGAGFAGGARLVLNGVVVPIRDLTSTTISAIAPPHPPGPVDVVVTNPSGESVTLTGGFTFGVVTLTASPSHVTAGDQVAVSWTSPAGRVGGDWITFERVGVLPGPTDWFPHTGGEPSGTYSRYAPDQPGEYEFRYFIENTVLVRSNPVTVVAPASGPVSASASR